MAGEIEIPEPLPVVHLTPRYSEHVMTDPRKEHLWGWTPEGKFMLAVVDDQNRKHVFSLPLREGEPEIDPLTKGMVAFGVRRVGADCAVVMPSLLVPGLLHAYLTLCAVPAEAPWEGKKIIT